jgi:hemerythrin-like domain-containing protein
MHKISLPGSHAPAATFDEPFTLLAACHDRVRRSLDLLQRLVRHATAQGADAQGRDAARDVLRYFNVAAPAHHEDEERHVIPALLASTEPGARAAAEQMLDDHVRIRDAWAGLQPLLETLTAGTMPDPASLERAANLFVDVHAEHLRLEDDLAFPHAHRLLAGQGADALQVMGREMAARRGVK